MSSRPEVIETTVAKASAELARRGLDPDDRITITIEPDELIPGRAHRGRAWSLPASPMTLPTG
jgi:hypothetical protein